MLKDYIKKKSFTKRLKKNELITIEKEDSRLTTAILIQRAIDLDIPIVVGSQRRIDLISNQVKTMKVPYVEIYGFAKNFTKRLFEADLPNGVLIDESVHSDLIDDIIMQGIQIRGGFELKGE